MKWALKLVLPMALCGSLHAGATFSRIKTWSSGETLTASDLNAEFTNILSNLTPSGVDDYSATTTEMRAVTDPYPASSESQATSLQGELERIRYQILEIKKAMQTSNVTYWYQDLPTAGVFTVVGSSVGVNDTTPDAAFDVEGSMTISTNTTIGGLLTVNGGVSFSPTTFNTTKIMAYVNSPGVSGTDTLIPYDTEVFDTLNEFSTATSSATITNAGYYLIGANFYDSGGDAGVESAIYIYVNNTKIAEITSDSNGQGMNIQTIQLLSANDKVSVHGSSLSYSGAASRRDYMYIARIL